MQEKIENHQDHVRFLENLEQVNQAIQGTSDLQQMMHNVLNAVLSIFDCDRAFLVHPCDPEASSWTSPMERTKPEYPGVEKFNLQIPMEEDVAETLRVLLSADGPVYFGPESEHPVPPNLAKRFDIKYFLSMAIYPKTDKPWEFGIHQCSFARVWTQNEQQLFKVIGQRITDSLSVLLSYQEVSENRMFLDNIFENIPNMVFVKDAKELRFVRLNRAGEQILGYSQQELLGKNDYDFFKKEEADFFTAKDRQVLESGEMLDIPEEVINTKYGKKFLHTKKIPLFDNDGKAAYLLGISDDITERKKVSEALQRSEERLTLAVDASQMGLWDWNIITGDVVWSDQCKALYGISPETSMSYELFLQALHPDDRESVVAALDQAVKECAPYSTTKRTVWPDGSIHWTRSQAHVYCDSAGEALRMVGVSFDITEFKQIEQALILREQEFRTLADNIPDYIVRYDRELRRVYVNPAWEKASGLSAKEVLHVPAEHIPRVPRPVIPRYKEKLHDVLLNGKPQSIEFTWTTANGKELYLEYTIVPEYDQLGNITGVLSVGHDLTERKRAEEKLRNLSLAIEQSPVSIVVTDISGRIEFVNSTFTEITGYSYAEALGKHTRILKSGETPDEVYRQLWKTIRAGKVWRGEFRNRKKNGELFWEYATIAPVKKTDNTISHYVAVKEDITERKKLEEQLRQSQKMEAVGQLAGGVAHDFNNMLGVIMGYTDLAMANPTLDNSLRDDLTIIKEAGLRSTEITRQLLAFARKQTINPIVLDLNTTLDNMLKLLRRLIGENIDLVWQPGAELWPIKMDPTQIDQILVNLCVNAKDAIDGTGKVTIETQNVTIDDTYSIQHHEFIPGHYVMLAVSDTGSGMDEETKNKIFEPFFTTKGMGKGTGLGLATVYGIVKQNKGFIYVYSEPGHGTTFKIYLQTEKSKNDQSLRAKATTIPLEGHETILVVEDELMHLSMVKHVLEKYGYRVLTASSPSEALLQLKQTTGIHLLLSDVILPDMNGPDLAKETATLFPDVQCLFMSGYTGNVIAKHGVLEEGINFIQKPFSMEALAKKVREVLNNK